jgi:hypothetical protein
VVSWPDRVRASSATRSLPAREREPTDLQDDDGVRKFLAGGGERVRVLAGDHHREAALVQKLGHGEADTAGSAGDEGCRCKHESSFAGRAPPRAGCGWCQVRRAL